MAQIVNQQYYSINEVARIFSISRQKVRSLMDDGKLKAIDLGIDKYSPCWRITKESVEKLMKSLRLQRANPPHRPGVS